MSTRKSKPKATTPAADDTEFEEVTRKLVLTPMSKVKPRNQPWLETDRIPMQATTIIGGGEGSGKSTYTADLAARVTRGLVPGALKGKPKSVIVFSTEDDPEAVLRPRFEAAGANLDRVFILEAKLDTDTDWIDLQLDHAQIVDMCRANDVGLIILDPLKSTLSAQTDDGNEKQLRRALEPLNRMAREAEIGLLGIMHYNKRETDDPRMLLSGLRVWAAVARAVLGLIPHPENVGEILIGQVKSNYGPMDPNCQRAHIETTYFMHGDDEIRTSRLKWLDDEEGNLQRHLAPRASGKLTRREEITAWLQGLFLAGEKIPAAEAREQQKARGFSNSLVREVQKDMGINPMHREDGSHYWLWTIEELS